MTRCAGLDYEKADADLNRIWPSIKAEAVESDAAEGNGKTDFLDALMSSQRAWIAYRDAECTRQGFEAHNGSMEPMLVTACLAEMTAKRIKDLQGKDCCSSPSAQMDGPRSRRPQPLLRSVRQAVSPRSD